MKRIIALITVLCCFCFSAFSQYYYEGKDFDQTEEQKVFVNPFSKTTIGGSFGVDFYSGYKSNDTPDVFIDLGGFLKTNLFKYMYVGVAAGGVLDVSEASSSSSSKKSYSYLKNDITLASVIRGEDDPADTSGTSTTVKVPNNSTWYCMGQLGLGLDIIGIDCNLFGEFGYFDGFPGWGIGFNAGLEIGNYGYYMTYCFDYSPIKQRYFDRLLFGLMYVFD